MNFLDIRGLIEYTHLSRATIYRYIRNNSIPSFTIGNRRLFDKHEIDYWVRSHRNDIDELPTII
jgi:excisionase family DNA binding protein